MPKCADMTLDDHKWAILLYGPAGVGKTHFLATLPKPIFVFDWDHGIVTLRGQKDIDYIEPNPEDWSALEQFWDLFVVKGKQATFKGEVFDPKDYATICLDSMTTFVEIMLQQIGDKISMRDRVVVGKHKGTHQADYNLGQHIVGDTVRQLVATNKHILLTSHERIEKDRATDTVVRIGPSLSPAMFQSVNILIDEIWRLDCKNVGNNGEQKRILITSQEGKFIGKARVLPPAAGRIEDPTFDKIVKFVETSKR